MNPIRYAITTAVAVIFLFLLQASPAEAVSSRSWRLRDRADFEKADLKTISMSEDGTLSLAPPLRLLYEAEQPFIWALAQDAAGNVYAAGGNDGVIYRIDAATGKGSEFFRVLEPEVHALTVDRKGRLYAGTAPGGRIYRIDPDGQDASTFETEEEYVWSMVIDDDGNLYAATGTEGRIVRIDPAGKGKLFFDSAETHIRTLVRDRDGTLLAGSAGHGLIFRIKPDGTAFVVYDTPSDEVVTLATAADGTIYTAIVSGSGRGRPSRPAPAKEQAEAQPNNEEGDSARPSGDAPSGRQQGSERRVRVSTEGKVMAVSSDGYGRAIWEGKDEVILSLALDSNDRLLMGSSLDGRIYALDPARDEIGIIAEAPSSQVTALARRAGKGKAGEKFLIAGSNLGTVALLSPGHAPSGTVESPPLDARSFATWGRITWKADLPRGTAVTFQGRSGNTEDPDRTWSEWGEELTDPGSAVLDLPAARFVQWRAILETDDPGKTPALHEVSVSYLQRNLPPAIKEVSIHRSGEARPQGGSSRSGGSRQRQSDSGSRKPEREPSQPPSGQPAPGKEPAVRYIAWNAVDPNGDRLSYKVEYRGSDETTWKVLKEEQRENFFKLDTTAMPDGTYVVRVTASDAPSNSPDQVLTTVRMSRQFDVDNTPPRVEHLKAEVGSPSVDLRFTVSDTFSVVRRTAYSVDAGDWIEAYPEDGMNDDLEESYALTVKNLPSGEHSIVVRASDAAGNVGAGKAIVEIP